MNEYVAQFIWVTLGVLGSVLFEPSVKYLFSNKNNTRGYKETFRSMLPTAKLVGSSIVIGGISFMLAMKAGADISNFYLAFLWGFGIDKVVTAVAKRNQ